LVGFHTASYREKKGLAQDGWVFLPRE
jgi:hypothetical protein